MICLIKQIKQGVVIMLLAYCRTSTIEQNLTRQLEAVKEYGVEEDNIYRTS